MAAQPESMNDFTKPIYFTATNGTILLRTDGNRWTITCRADKSALLGASSN